jgi:hypothetical protein
VDTEYFIADAGLAATLAEQGPSQAGVPTLTLDPFEPSVLPGVLWGIIEDGTVEFDPLRFDTWTAAIAVSDDELSAVAPLADGFVHALATLPDDRLSAVAARWATSDEWFLVDLDGPPDTAGMLRVLRDFARQAETSDQPVFVWYSH